ncbi:hypothetical protein Pcinc_004949 [Petrolisthes cinctipes]|uniref:Uncharacterized protein n=1 Tax=Petrolisthes cinctipes TaxID=88211 RepID=A0AAE1KZU4_PETCI|nr:hypothetical protein Pcinc_004949 [Petrolisthes cinctipes]
MCTVHYSYTIRLLPSDSEEFSSQSSSTSHSSQSAVPPELFTRLRPLDLPGARPEAADSEFLIVRRQELVQLLRQAGAVYKDCMMEYKLVINNTGIDNEMELELSPERPQRRKGSQSEKAAPDTRSTSPDKKSSKTPDRTSPTKTTCPSSPEKSSRRGSVEKLSASMKDHSSPSTEGKQLPPSKGEPMSKVRPE